MSYRIEQDFKYVGNDYWHWSAWIEADDAELSDVKEVVWILHPSFKQDRIVKREKSDKFRLNTAGWGIFLLRAEVMLTDGKNVLLKHHLRLEYPEPSGASRPQRSNAAVPASRSPTVYLSYSTEDSKVAAKLRAGLENAGLEVLDQSRLGPGEPWPEKLRSMLARSDGVLGLACEGEISPWVSDEIKAAVALSKPVLLAGGASSVGLPSEVPTLKVDVNSIDPTAIAEWLRSGAALR